MSNNTLKTGFFRISGKSGSRIRIFFGLKPSRDQDGANKKKFSQIGPAVPEEIGNKQTNTQTSCCYIREISKHRYLCQIIVVAWIFLFEKFHFYFIWKNVQKWHKKSGKCFMKHFIFTSILPDDREEHTNVETNLEMENIWKSWVSLIL